MKKRVLSLLIALAMAMSIVPAAMIPASADENPGSAPPVYVQLLARENVAWETNDNPFGTFDEPIEITGNGGPYTATITTQLGGVGVSQLVNLGIRSDGSSYTDAGNDGFEDSVRAPLEYAGSVIVFQDVVINIATDNISVLNSERVVPFVSSGYAKTEGFIDASLWAGWTHAQRRLSTTNIVPVPEAAWGTNDECAFSVSGVAAINTVTVTFYIDGVNGVSSVEPLEPETDRVTVRLQAREGEDWLTDDGNQWKSVPHVIATNGPRKLTVSTSSPGPYDRIASLVLMSDNSTFADFMPFIGKAKPAPLNWHHDVKIEFTSVKVNGISVGNNWNKDNDQFISVGGHPPFDGYVNAPLWNAWATSDQKLTTGITRLDTTDDTGNDSFGLNEGTNITSIEVEFTISGIPGGDKNCVVCDDAECVNRDNCDTLIPPIPPTWKLGDVDDDGDLGIMDALEILKHLAGIATLTGDNLKAALIVSAETAAAPDIMDALEILKYLAGIANSLDTVWPK